jgi:hypothetical protein
VQPRGRSLPQSWGISWAKTVVQRPVAVRISATVDAIVAVVMGILRLCFSIASVV